MSVNSVSQWGVGLKEGGPGSDKQPGGGLCSVVSSGPVTVTSVNVHDLPATTEDNQDSSKYIYKYNHAYVYSSLLHYSYFKDWNIGGFD